MSTLEEQAHDHGPDTLPTIHYTVLVDQTADWYPRTKSEIEYARQTYSFIKEVNHTGPIPVGVLPQMVEYTDSIPTRRWAGVRDVETALRQIARGELPSSQEQTDAS